jgi:hypothetical protein
MPLMKRGREESPGRPERGCDRLNLRPGKKEALGVELPSRSYDLTRKRTAGTAIGSHERGLDGASVDSPCKDMGVKTTNTADMSACPFLVPFRHPSCFLSTTFAGNTPKTPQTNGQQCFCGFSRGWVPPFLLFGHSPALCSTRLAPACAHPQTTRQGLDLLTLHHTHTTHTHNLCTGLLAAAPRSSWSASTRPPSQAPTSPLLRLLDITTSRLLPPTRHHD